jgi:tripartite-type tricarboxylate transporter receptor subunit TctC
MMKSIACIAGLIVGLLSGAAAMAQTYPTKTVRIIVPYQAGQGTDVMARYFAERLSKALGQTFYVDNKPGAGGNIGTEAGARSSPDGYTLTMGTNATHTMNEYLYASVGYDAEKDFAPIILVGMLPMVISANPSFPANSLTELIAAAKANPEKIDMALPSTSARIVFELLKERTGAPLFGVPYKGSATAMTEVVGGQVQLIIDTVTATRGHVAAGKLKALAITTLKNSELLPGVKSVAEQGVPGFEMTAWNAVYAPQGTPRPIIDLLNAEIAKILAQPETQQRLLQLGFEPAGGTPEQLAEFGRQERNKWAPLIKAADLKGD